MKNNMEIQKIKALRRSLKAFQEQNKNCYPDAFNSPDWQRLILWLRMINPYTSPSDCEFYIKEAKRFSERWHRSNEITGLRINDFLEKLEPKPEKPKPEKPKQLTLEF